MNATRVFKKVSMKKQDQDQQYEGDLFEMIAALARCAIDYTQVTGRVADFAEMLLGLVNDSEMTITRHTSVENMQ